MSRPLVYAGEAVLERASRLLPQGVVLENLVAEAISRGHVEANGVGGVVFLDRFGLVARVQRRAGKRRPKPRAWYVQSVEPHRNVDRRRNRAHKIA